MAEKIRDPCLFTSVKKGIFRSMWGWLVWIYAAIYNR